MNYDPLPWDASATDRARVQAIKDFIQTDASSWTDTGVERVIWNGATKEDHDEIHFAPATPPSTPPHTPAPAPTKELSIVGEYVPLTSSFTWLMFSTDKGVKVECRTDTATSPKEANRDGLNPVYPTGTSDLNFSDAQGEACKYVNDGPNPGKLVCGTNERQCSDAPEDADPGNPGASKGEYSCDSKMRQPVFVCPY